KFVVNNDLFYEHVVNHNALYDSNQVTFGTLYSNQPDFDIHNDVEYESDYPDNSMINLEGAQHGDIIENKNEELKVYVMFRDWDYAMTKIEKYRKRQGFKTRCYCVDRSSNCIRRRMLVCEHYGKPDMTKSKDPKKETTSKRV
ncbi:39696_t:CDS:2, partial [Gigaspora margarita]